jgi:CRISPR type IV-associated protein Csf1|tara:strand:- start:59992 stop:60765 length:774 start_codon:yes stop_codon:yes gene_type:complete
MPDLIYPSELVIKGAGLADSLPQGVEAETTGHCGICGKPHDEGDMVDFLMLTKSFTVENAIFDPHAPYRCLHCAAIMDEKEFIFRWGSAVVTADGLYPCLKRVHRGYWFLNPPEPPFTFYLQVSKSQHVAWRSPVNYSKDVVFFRLGEDVHKIRTQKIQDGLEATISLIEAHKALHAKKAIKRKPMRTALSFCDMKGQRVGQSELYQWVNEVVELMPEMQAHVKQLLSLTSSEAYALDFVLTENLELPEPVRTANIK